MKLDVKKLSVKVKKLGYPIRSYTDKEIDEFFKMDKKDSKKLNNKSVIAKP